MFIYGVEFVMENSKGLNMFFVIDKFYDLCYVDLVVNMFLFY